MTKPLEIGARVATRVTSGRSRYSVRLRIFIAVTLAAVAPQLLVLAWSQSEKPVLGRAWKDTLDASEAAAKIWADEAAPAKDRSATLAKLAADRHVWIRVLGAGKETLVDENHDGESEPPNAFESFFFGEEDATPADIDAELGPIAGRHELGVAEDTGHFIGCASGAGLVCQGIVRVDPPSGIAKRVDAQGGPELRAYVHAQRSTVRPVRAVYVLRHQLVRLSFITIPLALALALYAASRVSRPIKKLRDQALLRAKKARPDDASLTTQDDEIGDLAAAFNTLLSALETRRSDNQAFVADLVHQMKSPVAAVRATAEALGTAPEDQARAERLARVLMDSSTKLDRLVTDYLELARAEAGLPNEEPTRIDLGEVVNAVAARVRDDERYKDREIIVAPIADEKKAWVSAVPLRIEACFRELCDNAASFAGEGGKVTVKIEAGEEIVVTVSDSGPGIADADLPKVFTRFFTTRGAQRGTGLGLSLVRAIVEAHGGHVAARSDGSGATFEVRLPSA